MLPFAVLILVYMTALFFVSIFRQRNDVADVAWGLGFVLLVGFSWWANPVSNRALVIGILVSLWGLRLTVYLLMRQRGKGEDFRYRQWREQWGKWFTLRSYFQVYLLQGAALLCIATPIIVVALTPQGALNWLDLLGGTIWLFGFIFEAVGDHQLTRFKQNPATTHKIMRFGLWRYTRHPNYFGEVTLWWGVFLIGLSSPYGWVAVVSPLMITYLLLFVSGIPMLEKKYEHNAEFQFYKRMTSAFFPLPPRKI